MNILGILFGVSNIGGADFLNITICSNINDCIAVVSVFKTLIRSFMEFKSFVHGQVVVVEVALSVLDTLSWEV